MNSKSTPLQDLGFANGWDEQTKRHGHVNPCIRLYGVGPEGVKCKTCKHLFAHTMGKRWYKCDLRNFTHGPGSDHRVNWPACARYEERK